MSLKPHHVDVYHVFLASPGDVNGERQHVRRFFDDYNRSTAHLWGAEFKVIDWENYATIGVGRPQELITQQTLEKFKDSLAVVVGIMAQRFGSPSGKAESGTEEEFQWAKQTHDATGFQRSSGSSARSRSWSCPLIPMRRIEHSINGRKCEPSGSGCKTSTIPSSSPNTPAPLTSEGSSITTSTCG